MADEPKPIPTARQEIVEHLRTLGGEEAKVRAKLAQLSRALAITDQQLAGLLALQADYRACLTVLPEEPVVRTLTQDWLMLREPPREPVPTSPEDVTGHPV